MNIMILVSFILRCLSSWQGVILLLLNNVAINSLSNILTTEKIKQSGVIIYDLHSALAMQSII